MNSSAARFEFKVLLFVVLAQICSVSSAAPPQWVNVTVTSVTHTIYNGEIVEIAVAQPVTPCNTPNPTSYIVRDVSHLKAALALATTALVAGRQLNLYVTGVCDATGKPQILGVTLL